MKRGFILFMVALLVLFLGVVVLIYMNIGNVIVAAVEKHGAAITGTTVSLQEANFSPTEGSGHLIGLKVGNPRGFKTEHAFSFDDISFKLDISTLTEDVIVIEEVRIIAPEIIYEIGVNSDNLRALRINIEKAATNPGMETPGKKMIINDLYIEKGSMWISARNLDGASQTALINDIHMRNIGSADNGLSPARIIQEIVTPLMLEVTLAAIDTELGMEDQMHNVLEGAKEETVKAYEELKKQGSAALEIIEKESRDAAKILGREAKEAMEILDKESKKALEAIEKESEGFFNWLDNVLNPKEQEQ